MKKNLFLITEDEKDRILNMHKKASLKQYLNEQSEVTTVSTTVPGEEENIDDETEDEIQDDTVGFSSRNPEITDDIENLMTEDGYVEVTQYETKTVDCNGDEIERHTNFIIEPMVNFGNKDIKLGNSGEGFGLIRSTTYPFKHVLEVTYQGVPLSKFEDMGGISVLLLFDTPTEDGDETEVQNKQNGTRKTFIYQGELEYVGDQFTFERSDATTQFTICDLYKVFVKTA
jgi:hypothetical protein